MRTERVSPLASRAQRERWAPALLLAALLVVLLVWLARRDPGERIVTVEAMPKIVTVPIPIPVVMVAPAPAPPVRVQVRAAPKTIAPPPAATVAPPTDVTTRYREVGQLLKAHGTDALWQRYRWIRLGDCLTTDAKRADCVRMLDAIASDAAGQ